MGRARDDIYHILVLGQNLRQRLNHVFDSLVRREQAERKEYRFSFHAEAILVEIGIQKWQVRNAVRNHVDLAARHFEDFLQELGRQLAHHDQAIRKRGDLLHHPELVGIGLAKNGMERGHHRHLEAAQQLQDVTASRSTENSILVLQTDHVEIVEVQELSGLSIRSQIVLGERPSHPRRIVISSVRVVYRKRQQSSGPALGGYGCAQVGGKSSDSTLPRQIVPDHRDPTRQRWLRARSRSSC